MLNVAKQVLKVIDLKKNEQSKTMYFFVYN